MKYNLGHILLNLINNINISGEEDIRDIKDIVYYDFKHIYLLIILALIIVIVIYFVSRKKKINIIKTEKQVLPPEIAALEEISKLKGLKLIEQERYKEFYTLLSDIIRAFFEEKYKISALDRTTCELVLEIKNINILSDKVSMIHGLLSNCDLVKFAKHIPLKEDPYKMLDIAVEIIGIAKEEAGNV